MPTVLPPRRPKETAAWIKELEKLGAGGFILFLYIQLYFALIHASVVVWSILHRFGY